MSVPVTMALPRRAFGAILLSLLLAAPLALGLPAPGRAAASLTIAPITWDVIGLDSNKPATEGPDTFPVGARVCNSGGSAASNVTVAFVWDSANAAIGLAPGSASSLSVPTLAAGACTDAYFNVRVTRAKTVIDTARAYHITATADGGVGPVATPAGRQLYVQGLVSQQRNTV
ncbi:MAG TPA: CARDB domain-containing protein, partial [Candidatus Limnocylindrales bacterium]|nr:CARDB domain-containing protein [Candidatus Limnocylindrales bacterium]